MYYDSSMDSQQVVEVVGARDEQAEDKPGKRKELVRNVETALALGLGLAAIVGIVSSLPWAGAAIGGAAMIGKEALKI
jgi:hypothetical protein